MLLRSPVLGALAFVIALAVLNKLTFLAGLAVASDEAELLSGGGVSFLIIGLAAIVTLALVVFGVARREGLGWSALGWTREGLLRTLGLGLLGGVLGIGVTLGVVAAFGALDPAELRATLSGYTWNQRIFHLSLGLVAAFGEETIFRGKLQGALAARIGLYAAVPVGAVIFSLYHLQFHPIGLVAKTGLGVVLGALRGRDRSLYASGLAHVMHWAFFGFY